MRKSQPAIMSDQNQAFFLNTLRVLTDFDEDDLEAYLKDLKLLGMICLRVNNLYITFNGVDVLFRQLYHE